MANDSRCPGKCGYRILWIAATKNVRAYLYDHYIHFEAHARICRHLYFGYKKRNAKLDAFDANPPEYLTEKNLRTVTFSDIKSEVTLNKSYHDYLRPRYNLLVKVTRARAVHNFLYYASDLDYGHKSYIDKLVNEKFVTLRALERLQRRALENLHSQKKRYSWVRQQQEEEEAIRQNEFKQVKLEVELFKRNCKVFEARLRRKRESEERKVQDVFLAEAYRERQQSDEDYDSEWDPIEDEI